MILDIAKTVLVEFQLEKMKKDYIIISLSWKGMSGRKFLPMPFTTLKLIELGLFGRCLKGVWKVSGSC